MYLVIFDYIDFPPIDDVDLAGYKLMAALKVSDEFKKQSQPIIEKSIHGISPTVDLGVIDSFISESTDGWVIQPC